MKTNITVFAQYNSSILLPSKAQISPHAVRTSFGRRSSWQLHVVRASAAEELNPGAAMSQISHSTEADGAIHIVTLNRPDAQNALTMDSWGFEWDGPRGLDDWIVFWSLTYHPVN